MYHELPAMLLNEVGKQNQRLAVDERDALERRQRLEALDVRDESTEREIQELRAKITRLESGGVDRESSVPDE
jgi:hypothetical protein